jgi:hypothetical protein
MRYAARRPSSLIVGIAACVWLLLLAILVIPTVVSSADGGQNQPAAGVGQVPYPPTQDFQDVPTSSSFYPYLHNLYVDGIVGGYACGGPGEPCIGPANLPYYRPNATVSRQQMTKFVDLGRSNINYAIGHQLILTNPAGLGLVISTTTNDGIAVSTASGGEGINANCTQAGMNCWAVQGTAAAGDYAAHFSGGRGAYITSNDTSFYSLDVDGGSYRAATIKSTDPSFYSLFVDRPTGSSIAGTFAGFDTSVYIAGNLSVAGSKSGYVVDLMQNADTTALQPGDVVVIAGSAPAVLGQIPVITVKKASSAYDTAVAGIVDQVMVVPSAEIRAAYAAQEQARRAARDRQAQADQAALAGGAKAAVIAVPPAQISDLDGNVHPDPAATSAPPQGYMNVVTLGAYQAVKVDAGFGAIRPGDLLTTSPHAGYAMKADAAKVPSGAVIGKALAGLDSGTGSIPILVTLK